MNEGVIAENSSLHFIRNQNQRNDHCFLQPVAAYANVPSELVSANGMLNIFIICINFIYLLLINLYFIAVVNAPERKDLQPLADMSLSNLGVDFGDSYLNHGIESFLQPFAEFLDDNNDGLLRSGQNEIFDSNANGKIMFLIVATDLFYFVLIFRFITANANLSVHSNIHGTSANREIVNEVGDFEDHGQISGANHVQPTVEPVFSGPDEGTQVSVNGKFEYFVK